MKEADILMGKLIYYSALIPKRVRYRSLFNHMVARKAGLWDNKVVDLDKETLKSVKWWRGHNGPLNEGPVPSRSSGDISRCSLGL